MAVGSTPQRSFADLFKSARTAWATTGWAQTKHMLGSVVVQTGAVEPSEDDRCGGLPTVTKLSICRSTKPANLVKRAIRALTGVSLRSTASSAKWDPQSALSKRRNLSHSVPCGESERTTNRMGTSQRLAGSLGNSLRLQDK